jgi:hypothetical protein
MRQSFPDFFWRHLVDIGDLLIGLRLLKISYPRSQAPRCCQRRGVRVQGKGNLGTKPPAEAISAIFLSIKERRA